MKINIILKTMLSIIIVLILAILNLQNFIPFLLNAFLLVLLCIISINKKESAFLLVSLITLMSSLNLILFEENLFLILIYYISLIILFYESFKYVFNLRNNKMNLTFNTLKFPEYKNYSIAKYITGPSKLSNSNVIITIEKDMLIIDIEDNKGLTDKLSIKFEDITNIEIIEKPYFKTTDNLTNYSVDYMKSYSIGKSTGTFDSYKSKKIIKSYQIKIYTKTETINLLSFDFPKIFDYIKR